MSRLRRAPVQLGFDLGKRHPARFQYHQQMIEKIGRLCLGEGSARE